MVLLLMLMQEHDISCLSVFLQYGTLIRRDDEGGYDWITGRRGWFVGRAIDGWGLDGSGYIVTSAAEQRPTPSGFGNLLCRVTYLWHGE
jgi:hypothetical protein